MEDLISFEDLVVQPYNSYFNLEKELHEVKSKLSLMEERLKYLEDKIGYGCKGNLTLEEKINALDIKYEKLEEDRGKDNVKIHNDIKCLKDRIDCLEYNDSATEDSDEEEIQCVSCKNIETPSLPSITIKSTGLITEDKNYYGSLKKNIDIILQYKTIDRMTIYLDNDMKCNDLLRIVKETKILRLIIYSYPKLESLINLIILNNIKVSYLQITNHLSENELINIQKYCGFYKIQLKVI